MKRYISITVLAWLLSSCSGRSYVPATVPAFPVAMHDYAPARALVRQAYPRRAGGDWIPRLWLKGSAGRNLVRIDAGETTTTLRLSPPYYTRTVEVQSPSAVVRFFSQQFDHQPARFEVPLPKYKSLLEKPGAHTIVLYGCFQPFGAAAFGYPRDSNGRYHVRAVVETGNPRIDEAVDSGKTIRDYNALGDKEKLTYPNIAMREIFRNAIVRPAHKYEVRGSVKTSLWSAPASIIIGTGDQVYTDGGYHDQEKFGRAHPISAWTLERRPTLRLGLDGSSGRAPADEQTREFRCFLHDLYLSHGSFSGLEEALRKVPRVSTWDDHEIRDGWGSFEEDSDERHLFVEAKQAFAEHQVATGPIPVEGRDWREVEHFDQQLMVGDLPIYLFDTRTNRCLGKTERRVLSDEQICRFTRWVNSIKDGQECLIISAVPMVAGVPKHAEIVGRVVDPKLEDDLRDGWGANFEQLKRIMRPLVAARVFRGVKPIIVSGDVHQSAVLRMWYVKTTRKRDQHDWIGSVSDFYDKLRYSPSALSPLRLASSVGNRRQWYKRAKLLGFEMIVSGLSGVFNAGKRKWLGFVRMDVGHEKTDHWSSPLFDYEFHDPEMNQTAYVSVKCSLEHQVFGPNFAAIERAPGKRSIFHTVSMRPDEGGAHYRAFLADWDQHWKLGWSPLSRPTPVLKSGEPFVHRHVRIEGIPNPK